MNQLSPELRSRERIAQLLWAVFVLMFFGIQAIIWTVAISATASDRSHAVVEGYDEQAFHWDEVKQLRADSKALGWDADIEIEDSGDIRGNRVITLSLKDRDQMPLEDAEVELQAYHRGRAAEKQNLKLEQVSPGVYSAKVLVQNSGQWQFSGSAKSEHGQFLIEHRIALDSIRKL